MEHHRSQVVTALEASTIHPAYHTNTQLLQLQWQNMTTI